MSRANTFATAYIAGSCASSSGTTSTASGAWNRVVAEASSRTLSRTRIASTKPRFPR